MRKSVSHFLRCRQITTAATSIRFHSCKVTSSDYNVSPLQVPKPSNVDYSQQVCLFSGYYKKTVDDRLEKLLEWNPDLKPSLEKFRSGISDEQVHGWIENAIGSLPLPVGLGPGFIMNGQEYVVPFCVEEPSVIAACCNVAKRIAKYGGFTSTATDNIMTTTIQVMDVSDVNKALQTLTQHSAELVALGNKVVGKRLKASGGGVTHCDIEILRPLDGRPPYLSVNVSVNVGDTMGANQLNNISETLAPTIEDLTGGRVNLRILSNLCIHRRAASMFRIPVEGLSQEGCEGEYVAKGVVEAYEYAVDSPFRATTHNKGVMNGIDAVAVALGQDWRSIEASCHAYACRTGRYQPMTSFEIERDDDGSDYLIGRCELPISVGSVGGIVHMNTYSFSHSLLGKPSAQEIAQILVTVGLAQNFAALSALTTIGIQKGHMRLHARSVATSAGTPEPLVEDCAKFMVSKGSINQQTASEFLVAQEAKLFLIR